MQDKFTPEKGFLVIINNKTTDPALYKNGGLIQTGVRSNIVLSKTIIDKISTISEPCRREMTVKEGDSIYFRLANQMGVDYTIDMCRDLYVQVEFIIKNCACLG